MQFEDNGYLCPGENIVGINELFDFLVLNEQFDVSITRISHFITFLSLIVTLNDNSIIDGISRIVIDGSFCSNKINPNDMDIFIYYDISSENSQKVERYIDLKKTQLKKSKLHIIAFQDFSNVAPEKIDKTKERLDRLSRKRFERYYSYTKDDIPKGFISIYATDLIIGGVQDVIREVG